MKPINWRPGMVLTQDPDESQIYRWDWADWLDGEAVSNPPQIIAEPGITAELYYLGADYVDVRISGGTVGSTYAVTVRVTSSVRARIGDRSVRFAVVGL